MLVHINQEPNLKTGATCGDPEFRFHGATHGRTTMRNDAKAEVQHYVPKLLLRLHVNTTDAKKGAEQVWCFDKLTDKLFSPNIKCVFAGSRFYEIELGGQTISLEEPLTHLEAQVAPVLTRLIRSRKLREITIAERALISRFCAVQFVRTESLRQQIKSLDQGIADALAKRGLVQPGASNLKSLTDEEVKALSLQMLVEAPETYGPHFMNKHWYLIDATIDDPFHLGDQPIAVDNDFNPELGLASPGASVYLPLCPTLCLVMLDSTVFAGLLRDEKRFRKKSRKTEKRMYRHAWTERGAAAIREMQESRETVFGLVNAIRTGTSCEYDDRVVTRANALQIMYATRWIVSSRPNFDLPKRMIANNEKFRRGPKYGVV
ncbi:MAG TPA: DUF4238 domain-containing protein [Candidatus Acidoferrales bacterium]